MATTNNQINPVFSKWKGAIYFTSGRAGMNPEYFVIHVMDGTLQGTDQWFNNAQSHASAHSGIGSNGEVHDYVHSTDSAWHAGASTNQGAKWKGFKFAPNGKLINPNLYTLGIEHEGRPNKEITEAAYLASAGKIKYWALRYNIPLTRDRFVAHSDIYPGHNCPNMAVNIDKLFKLVLTAAPIYPETK